MDVVLRGAVEPDRGRFVNDDATPVEWLRGHGFTVRDEAIWRRALTHGSVGEKTDYERLEFLGDRVLGLSVATILFENPAADQGKLSLRLNALVSRVSCAQVARTLSVPDHVRLGRQARADGGADSDNILGDVMESLLGANYREVGFEPTMQLVRKFWADLIAGDKGRAKHPKSALQEWAAAHKRKPPEYRVLERSGPDHSACFTVEVSVNRVGEATAAASTKRQAETAAARVFLERYT